MVLGEAIHLALRHNPNIAVQRLTPQIAKLQIGSAWAKFDSQVEMNHHWETNRQRLASIVDTFGTGSDSQTTESYGQSAGRPDQLAISKTLLTGGLVRAGFSTGFSEFTPAGSFTRINPSWRSNASVQLTQPLARGRGAFVQMAPIKIANVDYESSDLSFQANVDRLLYQVEIQFWNLALSQQSLDIRRSSAEQARSTYEKEMQKFELGESSRPDLGDAKLNYYRTVSSYQQQKSALIESQRAFRELIGIPGFDTSYIRVELPDQVPELDANWDWSLATMLESRPDIVAIRLDAESAKVRLELAKNELLPDISLESRIGKSGLDSKFGPSVDRLLADDNWSLFVGVSHVRKVNNAAARQSVRQAFLAWRQQLERVRQAEYTATHELQQSYEQLTFKRDRLLQMANVRSASAERLAAYSDKFELGALPIELYLRAQTADDEVDLELRIAKVELLQSLAQFEFVRGTIRDTRSVIIGEFEPNVTNAENPNELLIQLESDPLESNRPRAPEFEELLERVPQASEEIFTYEPKMTPQPND